jgi:hypothetical protein
MRCRVRRAGRRHVMRPTRPGRAIPRSWKPQEDRFCMSAPSASAAPLRAGVRATGQTGRGFDRGYIQYHTHRTSRPPRRRRRTNARKRPARDRLATLHYVRGLILLTQIVRHRPTALLGVGGTGGRGPLDAGGRVLPGSIAGALFVACSATVRRAGRAGDASPTASGGSRGGAMPTQRIPKNVLGNVARAVEAAVAKSRSAGGAALARLSETRRCPASRGRGRKDAAPLHQKNNKKNKKTAVIVRGVARTGGVGHERSSPAAPQPCATSRPRRGTRDRGTATTGSGVDAQRGVDAAVLRLLHSATCLHARADSIAAFARSRRLLSAAVGSRRDRAGVGWGTAAPRGGSRRGARRRF